MIKFLSDEHKKRYLEMLREMHIAEDFKEKRAYLYIITGCDDLYEKRARFYDISRHRIKEYDAEYCENELCSSSRGLIKLAYNILYLNPEIGRIKDIFWCLENRYLHLAMGSLEIAFRR